MVNQQRISGVSAMRFYKWESIGRISFCIWHKCLTKEPAADSTGSSDTGFLDFSSLMDTSLFSGSGWNIVLSLWNVGHLGGLSGQDPCAYLEDLLAPCLL
jgi:hypothetical protein